jgi:surface protein
MYAMFEGASVFNQPLNSWNTSIVTDMTEMFRSASIYNQNISGWNVNAVINYTDFATDATAFELINQPRFITTRNTRSLKIKKNNKYIDEIAQIDEIHTIPNIHKMI